MAPIQLKFLKSSNSLIALLISLLGFSTSCIDNHGVEYGTPHADFLLKGFIHSSTDNHRIPDIKLEMFPAVATEYLPVDQLVGSARSDIQGRYELINYKFDKSVDHTYRVKVTDVDGELNGEYQSLDTTVVFQTTKFINGDGSWYGGVAETDLNFKLKPKQ